MKNFMRIIISLFLVLPVYSQAEQPELGKYPQMFSGDDYKITLLRVGKDETTVLIKVDGVDNAFDGQIYMHTKLCDNTACTSYKYETTEIPGKEKWWTIQSSRPWGDYDSMSFYPPGIDKKYSIGAGNRPDGFDSQKFYQEYLGQKALRK